MNGRGSDEDDEAMFWIGGSLLTLAEITAAAVVAAERLAAERPPPSPLPFFLRFLLLPQSSSLSEAGSMSSKS